MVERVARAASAGRVAATRRPPWRTGSAEVDNVSAGTTWSTGFASNLVDRVDTKAAAGIAPRTVSTRAGDGASVKAPAGADENAGGAAVLPGSGETLRATDQRSSSALIRVSRFSICDSSVSIRLLTPLRCCPTTMPTATPTIAPTSAPAPCAKTAPIKAPTINPNAHMMFSPLRSAV